MGPERNLLVLDILMLVQFRQALGDQKSALGTFQGLEQACRNYEADMEIKAVLPPLPSERTPHFVLTRRQKRCTTPEGSR
jgi:hypothetical protein